MLYDCIAQKSCLQDVLYYYGVRGTVLLWLQNFLTGRTHQTKVGIVVSLILLP